MVLRPEPDVTHADWFAQRDESWVQLCTAGPRGFEGSVRVFHAPADVRGKDVQGFEGDLPREQLLPLLDLLSRHTSTPGDCFFALWDGYGVPSSLARVRIPNRDYLLYRGQIDDADLGASGEGRLWGVPMNSPNLMWPRDRSWFAATEVDQPWSAIGGSQALIDEVLAHPGLDAEPFLPSDHPPYWRK